MIMEEMHKILLLWTCIYVVRHVKAAKISWWGPFCSTVVKCDLQSSRSKLNCKRRTPKRLLELLFLIRPSRLF